MPATICRPLDHDHLAGRRLPGDGQRPEEHGRGTAGWTVASGGLNSSSMVTGSSESLTRAHFLEATTSHTAGGDLCGPPLHPR